MYQGKRSALALLLAGIFVGLLSLVACGGGGGSSSSGGTLPQTSIAPTATLEGWTPNDAALSQYKVYTFSASATDPNIGGSVTEFRWDFGDGTTKTTPVVLAGGKATTTATYAYLTSGTPTLSAVAKNAAGLLSTAATRTLTVNAAPTPLTPSFVAPAAAVTVNSILLGNVSVTFTVNVVNTGTGTVSASGIQLDPGDATATQTTPASIGGGNWNITVTYPAASAFGSRTATPTLKVVDSNGASSSSVTGPAITVRTVAAVDNPPVITLVAAPQIVAGTNSTYQNVPIAFTATAVDSDFDTLTYTWTFGDGGKGDVAATQATTALAQSHTYAAAGIYPVTFTANDGRGSTGIKSITLNLNVLANDPPAVSVAWIDPLGTANSLNTRASVPITFTATVTDSNKDVAALTWDFGDGTPVVKDQNPITHAFAAVGNTVVTLTADDGKGGVTPWTRSFVVALNRPPVIVTPLAVIPTLPSKSAADLYQNKSYDFTATATDPDAGDSVAQYQWDFGDGTAIQTSTTGSAKHIFAAAGPFPVKVRAVDSYGSVCDWTLPLGVTVVSSLPVVTFKPVGTTSRNVDSTSGSYVEQAFEITVTNPQKASGATDPLPIGNISFSANDAAAAVQPNPVNNGGGSYTFAVRYFGAATSGTRTSTPSAYATDSYGIQGLAASGPVMTITTMPTNNAPTISLTNPATDNTVAWTSKPFNFGFTLTDQDNDPVSYTVDWNYIPNQTPTMVSTGTTTTSTLAGVPVALSYPYPDTFTSTHASVTIQVTASDKRSSNSQATPQTRLVTVTYNAPPTASIVTPQASGAPPTAPLPSGVNPGYTVIPWGGQLAFEGKSTLPGSQDPLVSQLWSFPKGYPLTLAGDKPADNVLFNDSSQQGVISYVTVTYTVTDAFGRKATDSKQVVVDGVDTQKFNLSFQYRQKSDNNGTATLAPVTTAINGLGAPVQIFQDGQSNTYNVQSQAQLTGAVATVSVPVRSDLPFYIKIPGFSGALDGTTYLMRIPNAPTGIYADPSLEATPSADSKFSFQNSAAPFNPTLQIVTAQGFAAEAALAAQRKLNGYTDLVIGTTPVNERWLDRLSVPTTDLTGAFQWIQSSNAAGVLTGIPAYQLFAEWPTLLITRKTQDLAEPTPDPTTSAGTHEQLGFVLDYPTYTAGTLTHGDTFSAFSMQAFRVPAGVTDPYQLSPAWQSTAELANPAVAVHSGLNPVPVGGGVTTFYQNLVNGVSSSGTPLADGIASLPVPYTPNDPDRTPLALPLPPSATRTYSGIRSIFAFSEYLWSTVWARPLVLNSARPYFMDSFSLSAYSYFRYSNPAAWPKASVIWPDNSAFDLTARGGGVFDASAPVAVGGAAAPSTGVGRFFWTAYTPSYTGDASQGQVISRTWLADDGTQQPPTTFSGVSDGDATVAFGFMPPQDTIVDKRPRGAIASSNLLGGYRVTWYNPTRDVEGKPVAPDFWVVELSDGTAKSHFMLPGSYPAGTQSVSDAIMTDARTYLPSGNPATVGPATGDKVGPGYCWFDIPSELRPKATSGVTLTVFGVKSILKNNPVPEKRDSVDPTKILVAKSRPLNRPDWMDAIKTATATIKVLSANGSDLSYAHKIPFNYYWDIVVVNGPATYVAP